MPFQIVYCVVVTCVFVTFSRSVMMNQSLGQSARSNFVKRVYSILSIQVAATALMVACNHASPAFARFQLNNMWIFWLSFATTLVTMIALFFHYSRQAPINYILLAVFTLAQAYSVTFVCGIYTADSVLLAATATLAATIGLTYHAATTKEDLTQMRSSIKGFGVSLVWIVMTVSLINLFFLRSSLVSMALSAGLAVLYSIYLLVDTQLVLGGRHKQLTLDDHILGAIILYMDIISLFLKILQLLGKKKND